MTDIHSARILIIAADGFEQSELEHPRDALRDRGATVQVATPDGNAVKGWDEDDWGREAEADMKISEASAADFDALILPGGQINPDVLRTNEDAVALIKNFHDHSRPIGAICHAPWLLIEAGIVKGRKATSFHSIRTDMENAGAKWEDSEVVADGGIITSRTPEDLEAFTGKIVEAVENADSASAAA